MTKPSTDTQNTVSRDLLASVVVFLVALPLCMGIAIASGVPPAKGLLTGIVGGLVVGSLAGSPLQVSGPAAGLAVIVFELVRDHGITALGPVLIIAGLLQIGAGLLRAGQWFRAMSPAVIYGMLAGIGILIFAGQFHVMLDDKPRPSGIQNLLSIPTAIFGGIFPLDGSKHELAALIGITTITILICWEKFRPKSLKFVPGALLAVTTATVLAQVFRLPLQYVNVPSNLADSIQWPTLAPLTADPSLLISAAAIAFVASAETLLSAAAVDQMQTRVRTNYDRELMAQGVGNSLCGLLGSLPMTGVIVRSSANVQAGAMTRLSAILHGAWILAFVALLPNVLRLIPICSLAGVLVYTGYKLANPSALRNLARYGRFPLVIYAATVLTILIEDLLTGVLVGVGLSLAKLVYKATHLAVRVQRQNGSGTVRIELIGAATFVRLPQLTKAMDAIPLDSNVSLETEHLYYIDHTCLDLLRTWSQRLQENGGRLKTNWRRLDQRFRLPGARPTRLSPRLTEAAGD